MTINSVMRAFIEKRPGADGEARDLLKDIRENLGLKNLAGLRIAVRYDVEGLTEQEFDSACQQIFCEKPVDRLFKEAMPLAEDESALAVEYLPGQYDQRADSAAQCIQLLTLKEQPLVRTARVYVLKGALLPSEIEAFRKYCVNPVDSRIALSDKPATLTQELALPPDVPVLQGFGALDQAGRESFHRQYGLSMSLADLAFCQEYFREEGREPSLTEIRVIDTYWSDHCRHTTFNTVIEEYALEEGPYKQLFEEAILNYLNLRQKAGGEHRPLSLMDMATVNTRALRRCGQLEDLDVSEEINACSIKVWADTDQGREPWLVMFKNETHNHPTEIEPFGGAATCIGGAIRDPLSGRAYVYQAMRVTGAANPLEPVADTLPGKLPQRTITRQAAAGYSSYGNQIGLATGLVDEVYHPGYKAKRMEIGAVIGAAPAANVVRDIPQAGDLVLLLGGRTGRDGCGGATGSSKAHDEQSIETSGAEVQKGNAPTERKLQRLYRNSEFSRLIKRCNDFGAGGVSVAIGELAPSLDIDLDKVPKKYEGLDGTELAISESQERMAIVIAPNSLAKVLALAAAENLEATVVAGIADHGRMKMTWRGQEIVNLSRQFLDTSGVSQQTKVLIRQPEEDSYFLQEGRRLRRGSSPIKDACLQALSELNICSKKGLIQRFDSSIGAATVLFPLGGSRQETPALAMAAKLPVQSGDTSTCTWMSYGFDPGLSQWSPFHGGMYAVVDALAKLAVSGGDPFKARMSFQEYFPRLGEDPAKWGLPMAALLGAQKAMTAFQVPAIGGKDSMSGTFEDLEVPPTLCAFAVSVGNVNEAISPEWKRPGTRLVFFPAAPDNNNCAYFEGIAESFRFIQKYKRHIYSAASCGQGGLIALLAKSAFGNNLGAEIDLPMEDQHLEDLHLFMPFYGSVLLELAPDFPEKEIVTAGGVIIGKITGEPVITIEIPRQASAESQKIALPLAELRQAWHRTLEPVFAAKTAEELPAGLELDEEGGQQPAAGVLLVDHTVFLPKADLPLYTLRNLNRPAVKIARPRVVIPVFPGTNCEYDSAAAFEKAGAVAETVILRNLSPKDVEESLRVLAAAIAKAQIIMIPGGFSGGDEPDGSGKLIATTFRSPWVKEQTELLLRQRDGLILGICNGFQGLIKLGLVPYGEIRDMNDDSPTLMHNAIGRHQSVIARTRVTSVKSPWLAAAEPGQIHHIPISHGEGRLKASPEELALLFGNGQVATQYVDETGKPSMDISANPNGSLLAIEGLSSPDGRVLGKMGHSERIGQGLYQNIPGDYDQKIFSSGVKYFG